ncbi:response regulator [Facilibium subflavum]|uniref:response regulator n=1 Tax=Facilibium subflavum TaxID=2219058 RepID=UPI000E647DB2|nr:response regulator [Facilibium subflavum]
MGACDEDEVLIPLSGMEGVAYLLNDFGQIVDCNEKFLELLNDSKKNILLKRFIDIDIESGRLIDRVHDLMLGLVKNPTQHDIETIEGGRSYVKVIEFLKLDDEVDLLFESSKRLIRGKDGKVLGLLNISKDIGEGKECEIEVDTVTWVLHECKQLLEVLMGKLLSYFYLPGERNKELMKDLVPTKLVKDISNDFNAVFSKVAQLAQVMTPSYENNYKSFEYKLLIVSDEGTNLPFFTEVVKSECFCVYISTIQEVKKDVVLQMKLIKGFFQFVVFDTTNLINLGDSLPELPFQTLALVLTCKKDIKDENDFLGNDNVYCLDSEVMHKPRANNNVTTVAQLFACWDHFRMNLIRKRVKQRGVLKVLFVEDHFKSQEAICDLISSFYATKSSFEVQIITAVEGSESLHYAINIEFDVVLLDLGLPDITGYDVALRIRAIQDRFHWLFSPIIVNTGHDFEAASSSGYIQRYGFDEIYLKPSIVPKLKSILDRYLPSV